MYADFFDKKWNLFLGKVKSAPSDFENRKKELQKSQKKCTVTCIVWKRKNMVKKNDTAVWFWFKEKGATFGMNGWAKRAKRARKKPSFWM